MGAAKTNMSNPFVLATRGSGGFSRDLRFAPAETLPPPPEAEAVDPLAVAYAEGHAAGMAQAQAAAAAEAAAADAAREKISFSLARLDSELAEDFRHKLHETVVALSEAALRPLALDPVALARRVECAVAMFVRADDERVIRLHPEDHALVAGSLPGDWQFVPDPSLERGALRVETATGGIEDGPLQWRAAVTEALRLC